MDTRAIFSLNQVGKHFYNLIEPLSKFHNIRLSENYFNFLKPFIAFLSRPENKIQFSEFIINHTIGPTVKGGLFLSSKKFCGHLKVLSELLDNEEIYRTGKEVLFGSSEKIFPKFEINQSSIDVINNLVSRKNFEVLIKNNKYAIATNLLDSYCGSFSSQKEFRNKIKGLASHDDWYYDLRLKKFDTLIQEEGYHKTLIFSFFVLAVFSSLESKLNTENEFTTLSKIFLCLSIGFLFHRVILLMHTQYKIHHL